MLEERNSVDIEIEQQGYVFRTLQVLMSWPRFVHSFHPLWPIIIGPPRCERCFEQLFGEQLRLLHVRMPKLREIFEVMDISCNNKMYTKRKTIRQFFVVSTEPSYIGKE